MADKNDILLVEYQACQSHNNSIGQQSWACFGIVFSANTLLLAAVAYNVIQMGDDLKKDIAFLVLAIAILMCCFLLLLVQWLQRVRFLTYVNHARMRKIEDEVQIGGEIVLEKGWLIRGLDVKESGRLCELSEERKSLINTISSRYTWFPPYKRPTDRYFIPIFFAIIIVPWIVLTVFAFVAL